MTTKKIIDHKEFDQRVYEMSNRMRLLFMNAELPIKVYPVPRGGIPVFYYLSKFLGAIELCNDPIEADAIVDDIIDSGRTRDRFAGKPFFALYNKQIEKDLPFIVFPWECNENGAIEDNIIRVLQFIGEDPMRDGLLETPKRVVKSWKELYAGYSTEPQSVFKIFDEGFNELVLMRDIELYSMCEHHMLPFFGHAHVAYIANGKVIGASKLARLVEIYARRLQVQERLGTQVVDALMQYLKPAGAACIIEAKHLCMCSRGVGKQHSIMTTSAMRGAFLEQSQAGIAVRAELMSLLGKK